MSLWSLPYAAGAFLERPEPAHSVVGLREDAQPERTNGDEQHRGAHECDEQFGVDLGRQATDGSDEPVSAPAQRTALLDDGSLRSLHGPSLRQGLSGSARSIPPPCW